MAQGRTETYASQSLELTTAWQTLHTVSANRQMRITLFHLVNCTNSAQTVRVSIVANGATPVQENAFLWDYSVAANSYVELGEGILILSSYSIQAMASADNSINLFMSGVED